MTISVNLNKQIFRCLISTMIVILFMLYQEKLLFGQETVDPRTGRLSLSVVDLEVQAGPLLLQFQRTLLPAKGQEGLLGSQWQTNWESRIIQSDSTIFVIEPSNLITFNRIKGQTELKGPSGEKLTLKYGQIFLSWPDGREAIYDQQGSLIEKQDTNHNMTGLSYGLNGSLQRIQGPGGGVLDFNTDNAGRVTQIMSSARDLVRYAYREGNLSEVQINGGPPIKYSYNGKGELVQIDRPLSGTVILAYDTKGRVISRHWADGSEEFYEYNDDTNTVRHINASGDVNTIERSQGGRREEITDALGYKTIIVYNENFQPLNITGPTGATSRMAYDSQGRVIQVAGCCGNASHFEYVGQTSRYKSITEADGTKYEYEYDKKGNVLSIKKGNEIAHEFSYYPDGLLKSMKGLDRPEHTYSYFPNGLLKEETDALGHTTALEYDHRGNLIRETNPIGGVTVREYNSQNRLMSLTDPAGAKTSYVYDKVGRKTKEINPKGETTQYEYDVRGRRISIIDPTGRTTRYQYDTAGRLISEEDPAGSIYRYEYDPAGNIIREINPLGGITAMEYNPLGLMISKTDPTGSTWKYKYSDAGLLVQIIDPLGGITKYKYDTQGRQIEEIDPEGCIIRYEFNDSGQVTKSSFPDGLVNTYTYDKYGNLIREANNRGLDIQYEYDVIGHLIREQRSSGLVISYKYDALGNLLGWQDNRGGGVSMEYNPQSLVSIIKNAEGASNQYSYDLNGRLQKDINPLGHVLSMSYTKAGELAEVKKPSKYIIKYSYDSSGRLTKIYPPNGGVTQVVFDPMGNLTEMTNPLGMKSRNSYDKAGRIIEATDAKNQTTNFIYDLAGNLAQKILASGKVINYKYNAKGNLIEINDGSFPIHYTYNEAGLLAKIDYPAFKRSISYEYNDNGLLLKFIDSEGQVIHYEYKDTELLHAVRLFDGQRITFSYDEKDRLSLISYPNHIQGKWEYDALDRPIRITYTNKNNKPILSWRYAYDAASNLLEVVDTQRNIIQYKYDNLNQLIEERGPSGRIRYVYSAGKNRKKLIKDGETVQYRHNKANHLLQMGDEKFKYDANGNLVERTGTQGITRYLYDTENKLVKVIKPDGIEISFGYAPNGQRIWRKDSSGITYFITDGQNLLAKLDKDMEPKELFVQGPGIDRPLILQRNGQSYYYHTDFLGSITALTDAKGTFAASYQTDAFGNLLKKTAPLVNPFLFTGREYESDVGLYYYRARYYDPELGRFLSEDPVWDVSGRNKYAYVQNAPTRYRDPLGLREESLNLSLNSEDLRIIKDAGLTPEQFTNRLWKPSINKVRLEWKAYSERYRLAGVPDRGEAWRMRIAKNDMLNRIDGWKMKGEEAIRQNRQHLAQKMHEYRTYMRQGPSPGSPSPPAPTPSGGQQIQGETAAGTPPPGAQIPLKNQSYSTVHDAKSPPRTPRVGTTTEHGPLEPRPSPSAETSSGSNPPPAPAAPAAPAVSSQSSSVSVPARPSPKWNPSYRGPTGMNTGVDNHNWKKLPSKSSGGSSGQTSGQSQWHQRNAAPILTVLLTTEMILRCRNAKMSAGQCAEQALAAAAVAAGFALTAAAIPATAPVIMVVGVGLMTIKGLTDLVDYAYEAEGAWQAKWNLEKILEDRKKWTKANLSARLDADLEAMKARIDQTLEGPAQNLATACTALDRIISEVTRHSDNATQLMANLPSSDRVEYWKNSAEKCQRFAEIQGQLETLRDNLRAELQKVKDEISGADTKAQDCDSESEAASIRSKSQDISGLLKAIQDRMTSGSLLESEIRTIETDINTVKSEQKTAMATWDQLIDLVNQLPSYETIKSLIDSGEAAKEELKAKGDRLKVNVDGLAKGYPDDMKSEIEAKFFELKQSIDIISHRDKCDPSTYLARFNTNADNVLSAKMMADRLLNPVASLDSELSLCDSTAAFNIISAVNQAKNELNNLTSLNTSLLAKAEDCLTRISKKADAEPPKLIKASKVKKDIEPKKKTDVVPPVVKASKGKKKLDITPTKPKDTTKKKIPPKVIQASKKKKPADEKKPPPVEHDYGFDQSRPYEIIAINAAWNEKICQMGPSTFMKFKVLDRGNTNMIVRQDGQDTLVSGTIASNILIKKGYFIFQKDCGYIASESFRNFGPGVTQGRGTEEEVDKTLQEAIRKYWGTCFSEVCDCYPILGVYSNEEEESRCKACEKARRQEILDCVRRMAREKRN